MTVVDVKCLGPNFTHATAGTAVGKGDDVIVTGKTQAVEAFAAMN